MSSNAGVQPSVQWVCQNRMEAALRWENTGNHVGFSWAFKAPKIMGSWNVPYPIGSMYGIYANIWGILMVNVTVYSIHGSYGYQEFYKKIHVDWEGKQWLKRVCGVVFDQKITNKPREFRGCKGKMGWWCKWWQWQHGFLYSVASRGIRLAAWATCWGNSANRVVSMDLGGSRFTPV